MNEFPEVPLPKEIEEDILSNDPSRIARGKRNRKRFYLKYERVGVETAVCSKHGRLSLLHFRVDKTKGKWYVDSLCIKCDTKKKKESREARGVKEKRRKTTKRKNRINIKKQVKRMSRWYIVRLLVSSGVKGAEITDKMIADKRLQLKRRRDRIKKASSEELRKSSRNKSNKRMRDKLTDGYVRARIKYSSSYNGEEITPEMIQQKREMILIMRKSGNRKYKPKKPRLN
jgi:hypothetical protein